LTLNIPGGNICSSQRIVAAIRDNPPLFNNQRNKKQTALPLPATGEQTGPKACQRQDQPGRMFDGETPEPCE
jgi:hypothetical protein